MLRAYLSSSGRLLKDTTTPLLQLPLMLAPVRQSPMNPADGVAPSRETPSVRVGVPVPLRQMDPVEFVVPGVTRFPPPVTTVNEYK
jgi:hypothetical protein